MAVMKMEEIRDMSMEEIDEKIQELRSELLRERTMIASGGAPENPGNLKEIKKTVARLLTVKKQVGESK